MILQFGAGNFLRGFAEVIINDLNLSGPPVGKVVVVQSTGKERAELINSVQGKYHVAIQGFQNGKVVDETIKVDSIEKALHSGTDWKSVCDTATCQDLVAILSNTTEAGLALDENEIPQRGETPLSFPAKLLDCLLHRFESGCPGTWIIPCELVENNGSLLRELVVEQGKRWSCDDKAIDWIVSECHWANTLVDRIVPGRPTNHPLLESDPLLISAEPFSFWAVETDREDFPFAHHPSVLISPDISPYTLRKVRILNGAHSALVCQTRESSLKTVRDCIEDSETCQWLERLLFDEIVPCIEDRCDDAETFARTTLDRFRNPFLDHQLSAIALNHESKLAVRLRPTLEEYRKKFGKPPSILHSILGENP